jgi:hypothetical protein
MGASECDEGHEGDEGNVNVGNVDKGMGTSECDKGREGDEDNVNKGDVGDVNELDKPDTFVPWAGRLSGGGHTTVKKVRI